MASCDQPHPYHPTVLSSFCRSCPPNHHPPPPPLEAHKTPNTVHELRTNVTNTQSYLCMERRRTRYRTALGGSNALFVTFGQEEPQTARSATAARLSSLLTPQGTPSLSR